MKNTKKENSIIAIIVCVLLLTSMLALISNSAFPYAKAQSTAGTTISSSLINDIYASPAGNDSRSFAGIGPGVTTPNIEWTAHIPGVTTPLLSGITAFGGYVFVSNATDTLALDGGTGNIVYALPNPPGYLGINVLGAPEYIGGNYMLLGDTCYTIDTGTFVWQGPAGFSQLGSSSLGQSTMSGGGALVTDSQYLPAPMFFNNGCGWELKNPAQPPTLLWNNSARVPSGLGSAYDNGVIVYATAEQTFSGFNAATGAYLWTVPVKTSQTYGTTAADGVFAFGAADGTIYAWNITTGELMWTFSPGTAYSMWASSLGSAYGMIYGHNQDGHFYAVNATTGRLVWSAYSSGNGLAYSGTFSIAGGYIYEEMGDDQYRNPATGQYGHSEFDCFNAYNGTEIWSLPYENGAPDNAQCNAYGNLYLIPTASSSTPGVLSYTTGGGAAGTLNEVVCIGNGSPESWSQYMNDATHNSEGWGPTNLTLAWSKTLGAGAPLASSPVFANGIGYIGSTDKNIYAFNASNGNVIWNFTTKAPVQSTPAVVNGYVFTGADDGNVYCLNAATGTAVWKAQLPAGPAANFGFGEAGTDGPPSPQIVGNNLYIGDNNYLYCLSTSTGAINWQYTWGSAVLIGTPTVVNGVVYIAPNAGGAGPMGVPMGVNNSPFGFLYLLDAQTGQLLKNITIPYVMNPFLAEGYQYAFMTGWGIQAPVTVDASDNIAFVQQDNQRTFAINVTSGKILWTYDAYYDPGTPNEWGTTQAAGVLYVAGNCYFNDYYSIVCVNALTGNVTWTSWLDRDCDVPLSYFAGNIYADTNLNAVYVLNAATGAKESYASCGNEATQPVPYADSLYVASGDFNITCFTQAAAQVTQVKSTPTPTPTPTQTPSLTSAPTAAPLSLSPLGWSMLYSTIAIIIAIIVVPTAVGALVLRTLKKPKP